MCRSVGRSLFPNTADLFLDAGRYPSVAAWTLLGHFFRSDVCFLARNCADGSGYFSQVFLSSELGADKPDPVIYERALQSVGFAPSDTLHVGDDPIRDWGGAKAAGLHVFELERPGNSLRDLLLFLERDNHE